MTVLVIGGVGGMLAGALAALPDVIAAGRPVADLADEGTLAATLDRHAPRAVICAGAFTDVDGAETAEVEAMHINADGPGALARLCATRGTPLVHVSTDYVFDGSKVAPWVETDFVAPLNAYGRSKLAGEAAVAAAGGRHAIVRASWVHAAHGKNFVRTMLRAARARTALRVVDDQHGAPTYAPHLAAALLKIADTLSSSTDDAHVGVFHAPPAGACTWRRFAEAIFEGSQARRGPYATVEPIATAEYPTPARRPANSVLDGAKLQGVYGIALPHWREGLDACLDALAADGWKVD
ncbi:MAG: dTDP-4-dehydrorhamnose reductase [Alphaproteobacteria bacterium]|nr:dTDP-4-dehydrorhamnose reductase [Alphaproteobacteria bacterium]